MVSAIGRELQLVSERVLNVPISVEMCVGCKDGGLLIILTQSLQLMRTSGISIVQSLL
jgi:hypothetical protein